MSAHLFSNSLLISLTSLLLTQRCYLLQTSAFLLLQIIVLPLLNQLITLVKTRTSLIPVPSTWRTQNLMSILSLMVKDGSVHDEVSVANRAEWLAEVAPPADHRSLYHIYWTVIYGGMAHLALTDYRPNTQFCVPPYYVLKSKICNSVYKKGLITICLHNPVGNCTFDAILWQSGPKHEI